MSSATNRTCSTVDQPYACSNSKFAGKASFVQGDIRRLAGKSSQLSQLALYRNKRATFDSKASSVLLWSLV